MSVFSRNSLIPHRLNRPLRSILVLCAKASMALVSLLLLSISTVSAQENCAAAGLVCNHNLQVSLSYDCTLDLDVDKFIENPIEGQEYTISFFDHHKRPIPELTADQVNTEISFSVSCGGNSCNGNVILEANHLPVFNAPCEVRHEQTIVPPRCRTWCGADIPSVFLTLDDMTDLMVDMCIPEFLGDIKETLIREGDVCDPDGETVTLLHEVKILTHGTLKTVELLRQTVIQNKIDIDTSANANLNNIVFPEDQFLNCNEGDRPQDIYDLTRMYSDAYPFYLDKHNLVPDSLYGCDTFILETIIGLRDTVLPTDTIDGKLIWELLTVIDKEFSDSIVCGLLPVFNPDSSVLFVPNEVPFDNRVCNLIASYSDVSFDACSSGEKIVRTWKIIDWCNSDLEISENQIIEVTDTEKPVILTELTEMNVIIDPWSCSAVAKLPVILAEDNCGAVTVSWYTDEGEVKGEFIENLWINNSPIQLTVLVADDCKNTDTMSVSLNIIDDTPPVAICNVAAQVVLTSSSTYEFDNGAAKLYAADFDEGSHDSQCGKLEFFVVRKEDWAIPVTNCDGEFIGYSPQSCSAKTEIIDLGELKSKQCEYSGKNRRPFVTKPAGFIQFCCEDANKLIEVIFIVQDESGNTNECLVTILVQNENGPELICSDAVITCEEDIHSVPGPELIDGSVCPASYLPIEYASESVNRSNCDSIVVTREWFIDLDTDGEFGAGDPHCLQDIIITGNDDQVEFICEDISLPCNVELDSIPIPKIAGNKFCVCDEDLIRIGSSRYSNTSCGQDTLIVEWYFDADNNQLPDSNESNCTQRIALTTQPETFTFENCPEVTISCNQELSTATVPTILGQGPHCLCVDEFLKTEFVGQAANTCENQVIQRSWYIDANQNNRKDDTEAACLQNITVDYSDVSFELRCTDIEISCTDDPALFYEEPEVVSLGACDCPEPTIFLLEETRSNNSCATDTIARSWFLDVNGNSTYEIDEPKCIQHVFINNFETPVQIECEDATISCLADLNSLYIPTVINQNTCGCTSSQLELRNPPVLDGLCYGDQIVREWYVDLDRDRAFDSDEPSCIQTFTLAFPEADVVQNNAMTFDCSAVSVSCIDNLDNVQAPALFSEGVCRCEDVSVIMQSQTSISNVCVGDTIFREWYADINQNNNFDNNEPTCIQPLIIVGNAITELVCSDEVITCTAALNDITTPGIDSEGFCSCSSFDPTLLSQSNTDDLCVGDSFTRTWYIDIDQDGFAAENEPLCTQTIRIQDVVPGEIENCGPVSIACDTDINTVVPNLNIGAGLCSCMQGINLVAASQPFVGDLCLNDTIRRDWFIDVNNNGLKEQDELGCTQELIVDMMNDIVLVCSDYSVSCLEENPPLVPPTIDVNGSCNCDDIQINLHTEFGAEDGCVGDTLVREWYADLNQNNILDSNEPMCIQNISLSDDNAFVSFVCERIEISCTSNIEDLPPPDVMIQSACGCMDFVPLLFRDGLSDSLCVGDSTSRMWYIDLDGDEFADENEPYCLQAIVVTSSGEVNTMTASDTTRITCATDIDTIRPSASLSQGLCNCEDDIMFVLIEDSPTAYCFNDVFERQWAIDLNNNGQLDDSESTFTQYFIVDGSTDDVQITCADQRVNCQFDQVPAQLPTLITSDGCTCPDIQPLILRQFGAVDRCVGDTLFREWYADINANNNFDDNEPTCIQNIILEDTEATLTLSCEDQTISCQTVADSIPVPEVLVESACGCMDFNLTLLSDGSGGGICFGESFIREWYVDANNDGIPQDSEASCRQSIRVDGSMSEMSFNCEAQFISCTDTLSQIAPPEINTVGICTCNQFELSIAEVIIDGPVCVGDTIIQRWFVDSNPNGQFDSLDVSCDQLLILQGEAMADFICSEVAVSCDDDLNQIPPPPILGEGLCSCIDLPRILIDQSGALLDRCLGDETIRNWFLDMNRDSIQDDGEPVCEQIIRTLNGGISFQFENCDTLSIACNTDLSTLAIPTITSGDDCVCGTLTVREVQAEEQLLVCSSDTIIRLFYGDTNDDMVFTDGEPFCNQIIIISDTLPAFDPNTIKWPKSFIGESRLGIEISCNDDQIVEESTFVGGGRSFSCMPQDLNSRPFWCDTECGLITYSVTSDTTTSISACFTIMNTYTVIDWCTYDPSVTDTLENDPDQFDLVKDFAQGVCSDCGNAGPAIQDSVYFRYREVELDGVYRFRQEISVDDDEPPIITVMQDTVIVNVNTVDSMFCIGSVDVTAEAMDMCDGVETSAEMIQWTVRVVDNERVPIENEEGRSIETFQGVSATINSREGMPGDTFNIVWTVRDGCNTASIRETQVIFIDTTGTCDTMSTSAGIIAGKIHLESGQMVEDAMVALQAADNEPAYYMTNQAGEYAFYHNALNTNYKISVTKDDAYSNGVSTADLIIINNHLLGKEDLNSPYKIIAADATNDEKLSSADVLLIKKLILESIVTFPNNESWRFVNQGQDFFDEMVPWPFIEISNIYEFESNLMSEDFIGVKIGDVNLDAKLESKLAETRALTSIELFAPNRKVADLSPIEIPIKSNSGLDIKGFQGTFRLQNASNIVIQSGALIVNEADVFIQDQYMTVSAHELIDPANPVLFTLTITPEKELPSSDLLLLNSEKTQAEIYIGDQLEVFAPILTFIEEPSHEFTLQQNQPNPFNLATQIRFFIPAAGDVNISIHNVTGQVVFEHQQSYQPGEHSIVVDQEDLPNSGLYFYTAQYADKRIVKTMLAIE